MIINFSNHPSSSWDELQRKAAKKYNSIYDMPFPAIDPSATSKEIVTLADTYLKEILSIFRISNCSNCIIHIMGELTFSFILVAKLQKNGITCLASTSKREAVSNDDGTKTIRFKFVQFREYPYVDSLL